MPAVISLLRGVNVGGNRNIAMDALRELFESLGLHGAQTYIQSGNVVFHTAERDLTAVTRRIEDGIEESFGFRPAVIVRTGGELRDIVTRNPFASREGLDGSKLLILFLSRDPGPETRERVLRLDAAPEEVRMIGRELYIYYPNGMARPKLPAALLEKTLGTPSTGRNWNTARKLLEMANELEASH